MMLVVCNTSSCVAVMSYCWVSGVWVCVVVYTWAQKATINFQHFQHYCSVCSDHPRVHLSARDSDSYNESREVGKWCSQGTQPGFNWCFQPEICCDGWWIHINPIQPIHLPEIYCFSPHHRCQARLVSRMLGLQSQEDWYSFVEADAVRALARDGPGGGSSDGPKFS